MAAFFSRRRVLATAAAMSSLPLLSPGFASTTHRSRSVDAAGLKRAGELVDRLVDAGRLAGAAVRIAQHGKPLFEYHAGKADLKSGRNIGRDTIYRAYSMTKPVTAAAIMILVGEGRLLLRDPVEDYVPEFSDLRVYVSETDGRIATEPARTMHVMDLLTHTSGISNSWNPGPIAPLYREAGLVAGRYLHDPSFAGGGLPDFAARMATVPLQFQPRTQWLYSYAPDIAGLVVERATGMGFGAFLRERIFSPLGMVDTDFFVPPEKSERLASMYALENGELVLSEAAEDSVFLERPQVQSGAAGLLTTLEDYGRFASMLAGRGVTNGVRVLGDKEAQRMMASHVDEEVLGDSLERFLAFGSGGSGEGMGAALGGAVLTHPERTGNPDIAGEYTWGGAASTTFFSVPEIGLDATLMTQLMPSGTLPLRNWLKASVYEALT